MRRANKSSDSEVLANGLKYEEKADRGRIREILSLEQDGFCAYTDKQLGVGHQGEIEHFNPHLKGQSGDNYYNWYVCHGDWNRRKGSQPKWDRHQPILSPEAEDFESRVRCDCESLLYVHDEDDTEAENLSKYLMLNDHELVEERLEHVTQIQNLKDAIEPAELAEFLKENPRFVQFPRFLKEIFHIPLP